MNEIETSQNRIKKLDLEIAANSARNELLAASLKPELNELKSVIEKFEKEN